MWIKNYNGDTMIRIDSRKVQENDTFIAIKGYKDDGHNYIEDAIKKGAKKIIAEHGKYSVETLIVDDTKEYLKEYIKNKYKKIINKITIIGITGTNGKTTISYLIYNALNSLGIKCSMIGTLGYYKNKKIQDLSNTCPDIATTYELILDSYKSDYKYIVLEASSQGLKEGRLYGIEFDYAIFTNLTHDHLDYHKNMQDYLSSKQILFSSLKPNGTAIVNIDDKYSNYFTHKNRITYGFSKSDYQITNYNEHSFRINNNLIETKLLGKYNAYNLTATMIVLKKINIEKETIKKILKELDAPSGRMEIHKYKTNRIVIDYAHTPDAIKKVLETIKDYNNIYAVFGCTGNRDRLKRPIMTKLLLESCKKIIITEDDLYDEEFEHIVYDMLKSQKENNYEIIENRKSAIKKGIEMLENKDVLLILGKGHEEYIKKKNEYIKHNDAETVKKIINEKI